MNWSVVDHNELRAFGASLVYTVVKYAGGENYFVHARDENGHLAGWDEFARLDYACTWAMVYEDREQLAPGPRRKATLEVLDKVGVHALESL